MHSLKYLWIFRIALGIYLAVHFAHLIPWGSEVFSGQGVLDSARLNATYGLFPNLLIWIGGFPGGSEWFLVSLFIAAVLFTTGYGVTGASLYLWYGWACLFNSNNLILNPSLPYIGWLLLAFALISATSGRVYRKIYIGAWLLLAVGYAISGWAKLQSPSWQNGEALLHVFNNPLARDYFLRDWLSDLPLPILKSMTWSALALELLFLPLVCLRETRFFAWAAMVLMHIGIGFTVSFADLTTGMLLVHLFTFDSDWLDASLAVRISRWRPQRV